MSYRPPFDWDELIYKGIVVLLILCGIASVWFAVEEQKTWAQFSAEHNCRKVGEVKGGTSTGFGYGMTASGKFGTGIVTTTEPDKTGWLCDDGVTYWR